MTPPPTPEIPSRFRVLRDLSEELGAGTYLVEDRLSPERRCMLTLVAAGLRDEAVREEMARVEAFARLRHPRLTPVVAIRSEPAEGAPYFVVELPEGRGFLERVREAQDTAGPLASVELVRKAARGICEALDHLHQRGLLHLDVRPARILLDRNDEPILAGLGLAVPQIEETDRDAGSFAYTAPEILRGDPVDHRADLYSLGVVLYEALSGRNPYLGRDAAETVRAHLELLPPPPSTHAPQIPRALDDLVVQLLAKNPSHSLASARDLLAALEAPGSPRAARRRPPRLSPFAFTQNEFVGRRRELRWLAARFRACFSGRGPVGPVILEGAGGVGKSRMLSELRQHVRLRGGLFLEGRLAEGPQHPLEPIAEVMRRLALLAGEDSTLRSECDKWLRAADAQTGRATGHGGDPSEPPDELGERAAAAVREAASRQPIVVALEDVHRIAGPAAAALTSFLAGVHSQRSAGGPRRILVCISLRPGFEAPAALAPWLEPAPRGAAVARLSLREFSQKEIQEFVATIFGAGRQGAGIVDLLAQTAGGNPFLLEETIRSWIARGLVRWREGRWEVDAQGVRRAGADLRALVQERLRDLSPSSERWLRIAAVLGRPITHRWSSAFGASDGGELAGALQDLFQRGFLRRFVRGGEERFEIAHALLAEAVAHGIPERERGALHRELALALEQGVDPQAADALDIARQWHRAGDSDAAARALLREPEAALLGPRLEERVLLLRELLDSGVADARLRVACACRYGLGLFASGDVRRATPALEAASRSAEREGLLDLQAAADEHLAAAHQRRGALAPAMARLRSAKRAAKASGAPRASLTRRVAEIELERGQTRRALTLARRALRLARSVRSRAEVSFACVTIAACARRLDQLEGARRWLRRARAAAMAAGLSPARVAASLEEGRWALAMGDYPLARRRLGVARSAARALGLQGALTDLELELARAHAARGDRAQALLLVRSALAEMRRTRAYSQAAMSLRGHLESQRGRHRRARRLFDAADATHPASGITASRLAREHLRFLDRFRAGDVASALRSARAELAISRSLGSRAAMARSYCDLGEHFRVRGRLQVARRYYLKSLRRAGRGRGLSAETRFRASLGLARTALASGRLHPTSRWLSVAERAFLYLRRYPELSDLRAALGEAALAAGDSKGAQRHFLAALRIDDRLARPAERADDLQGLARAALLGKHDAAAIACAALAEEDLASIPAHADESARPGADVQRWTAEVRRIVDSRRRPEDTGDLYERIHHIGREMVEGRAVPSAAERLARAALELLGTERVHLLLDRRGGAWLAASAARPRAPLEAPIEELRAARLGLVAPPGVPMHRRRAWISEPLLHEGSVVGALVADSSLLERRFDERDRGALRALATVASLALGPGVSVASSRESEPARIERAGPIGDGGAALHGTSPAIRKLRRAVARAAASDLPVLIVGETGSGKELVARRIHESAAPGKPWVLVDCGALAPSLAEAELFGVERGAYSGADASRPGLLERADGGTLVLDAIDLLPLDLQRSLRRALESGEIRRLGGAAPIPLRFRVISTTTENLESKAASGAFRSDLYYRVRGMVIDVPPLRERREDIPALIELFVAELRGESAAPKPSAAALRALMEAPWSGNVRQLRAEVARWCASELRLVGRSDLALDALGLSAGAPGDGSFSRQRESYERDSILQALERARGRMAVAARYLRMPRSTLYWKVKRFGLLARVSKN